MRQVTLDELRELLRLAAGRIFNVYLHWSAGHYGQPSPKYHINIGPDGEIIISTDDMAAVLEHTWRRNTGALGVTMNCCAFATSENLGNPHLLDGLTGEALDAKIDELNAEQIPYEPPTAAQIETMAAICAVAAAEFGWEIDCPPIWTHAEIATEDGYGPGQGDPDTRWDLLFLPGDFTWWTGGERIRQRAREIRATM